MEHKKLTTLEQNHGGSICRKIRFFTARSPQLKGLVTWNMQEQKQKQKILRTKRRQRGLETKNKWFA